MKQYIKADNIEELMLRLPLMSKEQIQRTCTLVSETNNIAALEELVKFAINKKNTNMIMNLLWHLNVEDFQQAFLIIVRFGNLSQIDEILKHEGKFYINEAELNDSEARTPLMIAASIGRLDILNRLIMHGADINKKSATTGYNSLGYAIKNGNLACATSIIFYIIKTYIFIIWSKHK